MAIPPLSPSETVTAVGDAGVAVAVAPKDNALGPFRNRADQAPPAATSLLPSSNEPPRCDDDDGDGGAAAEGWNLDVLLRGICDIVWSGFSR